MEAKDSKARRKYTQLFCGGKQTLGENSCDHVQLREGDLEEWFCKVMDVMVPSGRAK